MVVCTLIANDEIEVIGVGEGDKVSVSKIVAIGRAQFEKVKKRFKAQERADPDWANTSIKPFQHTSRRKKALTPGRRTEKFQAVQTGDRTQGLRCAKPGL